MRSADMPESDTSTEHDQRSGPSRKNTGITRRAILQFLGASGAGGLAGCFTEIQKNQGTQNGNKKQDGENRPDNGKPSQKKATVGIPHNLTKDWQATFGVSPYWSRILEPLTWPTHELKAAPWLATDWKRTGEKTWEFSLRKGVTFHNGEPLNTDSVIFSLKKILQNPYHADLMIYFSQIDPNGFRKVDDLTVEITTFTPMPNLPKRLTHLFFAIQHPNSSQEQTWGNVIGTGPYKEEAIKPDEELRVSAYEDYWQGPPKLEGLTYRFIGNKTTRALALEGDKIDVGLNLSTSKFHTLQNSNQTHAVTQPQPQVVLLHINNTKPPTDDVKLRKALNYCVSQKQIIDGALSGLGDPAKGPVPPMIAWSAHESLPTYGPDKGKAKRLVAESNYNDETIKILSSSQSERTQNPKLTAQIFQQQAKDIGIDVDIQMLERAAFDEAKNSGKEGHLFQTATITANALAYDLLIQYGSIRVSTPFRFDRQLREKLTSLYKKGRTARDPEVTKKALRKLQHIIVDEEAIMVPLYYKRYVVGTRGDVAEFDWHPLYRYQRMEKFELAK